jgi:hypothetical protein
MLLLGDVTKGKNSHLAKLPYFIHAIPSSTAVFLRSFSTAGGGFRDRRTYLTPRAIDIIFLNSILLK